MEKKKPATVFFLETASKSHPQSAHLPLSRMPMRHVRWQVATYVHHRSLNNPYILLQLVKFSPRRQIRHFSLDITDHLKHSPILVNNVFHKHTQLFNVSITHTTSLALFLTVVTEYAASYA